MTNQEKKIRVRFAPSPTGYLHIGGLRTALYNYLFARKHEGVFALRIEDTDQKRFVAGAVENLIKALEQMGLNWDEGVFEDAQIQNIKSAKKENSKTYPGIIEAGEFGPYVQSERLELYKKYAEQLVSDGKAYYCFCDSIRLEEMREKQQKEKLPPMYDRYCLDTLTPEEVAKKLETKIPVTIRLKVPKNEVIEFEDIVRGKVKFNTDNIDDQVLFKSDGFPTYHLASVVDDHLMEITQVIRGEEWLPSTPKHILLYRAFGWQEPDFAHIPLLLNADKSKLSKRQGDVAVEDYLKKGYLKEAVINFVAMLGWNEGEGSVQEIFSMEELIQKFDLKKVHKAGAVFDIKKLDWINGQYIKKIPVEQLYSNVIVFLAEKDYFKIWSAEHEAWNETEKEEYIKRVLTIEQDRLQNLSQVGDENEFFFRDINFDKKLLYWKEMSKEKLNYSLEHSMEILSDIDWENQAPDIAINIINTALNKDLEVSNTINLVNPELDENNNELHKLSVGELYWPLRVALTGQQKSPSPADCAWVLGKKETLRRIENALSSL